MEPNHEIPPEPPALPTSPTPPPVAPPPPPAEVFFGVNSARITFREFRWGGSFFNALLALLFSRLGTKFPNSTDDPNVPSLRRYRVGFDQFPPEVAERFDQNLPELCSLGFDGFVFHRIVDVNNSTWIYTATAAHSSGNAWVRLHHRIWTTPNPARLHFFPMFLTRFTDGTWLWSSGGKPDLLAPKECETEFTTGAAAGTIWDGHQRRIGEISANKTVNPVSPGQVVIEAAEQHHAAVTAFHLARGVFVQPSATQQKAEEELRRQLGDAAFGQIRNPEVLAEVEKLQTKTGGWGNAWIIFFISMLFFLGAGRTQWSWGYVLLLLPVLFVHEAGHWLAMKSFGYRNLKMFFIPFFGAAVSGVNYNVPGWKKAVVSLAGPVPGIMIGVILGISGLITGNDVLIHAALVCVLLNGFNLIPVLPLDGGWVVHTTLFCRNPIIDVSFRALAGLGLVGLGMVLGNKILMFLSIPSFLRLPIAYRLSKISHALRREGFATTSDDARTVPLATADEIATRIKASMPKGHNAKVYAQFTLEVFETLNARPPGWLATSAFLLTQVGCIVVSALLAIFLFIGKEGSIGNFFAAAALQPTTPLSCAGVESRDNNSAGTGARTVIVTKLRSDKAAAAVFTEISRELPDGSAACRIGSSIVFSHPASNDALRVVWFKKLEAHSTNTFVGSSNQLPSFRLAAIARSKDEAGSIAAQFEGVSSGYGTLIPPWSTDDSRQPSAKASQAAAARTLRLLEHHDPAESKPDPNYQETTKAMVRARRQGDATEAARLGRELARMLEVHNENRVAAIIATNQGTLDDEVVALFRKQQQPGAFTNSAAVKAIREGMANRLGAELQPGAKPGYRYGFRSGYLQQESLLLIFNWVTFEDPAVGVPAFLEWLCAAGVQINKYDFSDTTLGLGALDSDE